MSDDRYPDYEGFDQELKKSIKMLFKAKQQERCPLCEDSLWIVFDQNTDTEKLIDVMNDYQEERFIRLKEDLAIIDSRKRFLWLFLMLGFYSILSMVFETNSYFALGFLTSLYGVFHLMYSGTARKRRERKIKNSVKDEIEAMINDISK